MGGITFIIANILMAIIFYPLFTLAWLAAKTFDKKWKFIRFAGNVYSWVLINSNAGWRVKVNGLENVDKGKNYLILINHAALYDIPVVNLNLPLNMRWVAKHELLKTPILGHMLQFKNDILVNRGDPESAKHMFVRSLETIRLGLSMAIFPEGTRTKDGKVHEFKDGAFLIAKKGRVPILPIVLKGSYEAYQKPYHGIFSRCTYEMHILPEIPLEKVRELGIKDLTQYTYEIISSKHKEIAPELYK